MGTGTSSGKPKTSAQGVSGESYDKIPYVFRFAGGSQRATQAEKQQRKETIDRFMKNAKVGNVYAVGGGVGSSGGAQFEVVSSRGKPALKWKGTNRQPVQLNRANVESFISNGARRIK